MKQTSVILNSIYNEERILLDQIQQKIEAFDKIAIFTHVNPDPDCYGSAWGLQRAIKERYAVKEVVVLGESVPEYIKFIGSNDSVDDSFFNEALGIAVDTANIGRVSDQRFLNTKFKIKIDHHIENETFGDISWVRISSSCAENVALLLEYCGYPLNKNIALPLYTGMVTDNGRFMYRGVNALTHYLASQMHLTGLNPTDEIFNRIYLGSVKDLVFKSFYLKKIKIENGFCYSLITDKVIKKYKLNWKESPIWLGNMANLRECHVWMQFVQTPTNVRCEFRSRKYPVFEIAAKFGGGGHLNAAGAKVQNFKEVEKIIEHVKSLSIDEWVKTNSDTVKILN